MKSKSITAHWLSFALVAALTWTLAAPVQSQNASDQGTGDQNSAAALEQLQPVVITAERRTVDLQQAAAEVDAISGSQLVQQQLTTIDTLTTAAAGFQSSSSGGFYVQNTIRGMGEATTITAVSRGIPVIIDGLVNGTDLGHDVPFYDVSDTEVLQGPQGTFIGASAIAGAVEVATVNPNFNGLNGFVMSGFGNYTDQKFQGGINLPMGDTFAMRVAFNFEQRNSFYYDIGATSKFYYYNSYSATNPASDGPPQILTNQGAENFIETAEDVGAQDNHQFRIKALWRPTDNFQGLALVDYTYNNHNGNPTEPNPATYTQLWGAGRGPTYTGCTTQSAKINYPGASGNQLVCASAGLTSHSTYYYPGEVPFQLDYYEPGGIQQNYDIVWDYGLNLQDTLPDGITARWIVGVVDITTERESSPSAGPEDAGWSIQPNGPGDREPQSEIDIISPTTGKVNWIAGASWNFRKMPGGSVGTSAVPPYSPGELASTETISTFCDFERNEGVFGQLNWQFAKTLQLGIGARENWDNNAGSRCGYAVAPPVGTTVTVPGGTGVYSIHYTGTTPTSYTVVEQTFDTNHFTDAVPSGKVNLSWTPLLGQNFYVFYARGYRAGGVNTTSTDHPTFAAETVNDFEAGWKGTLLDNHLRTQVSTWYEKWDNFQNTLFDPIAENDTETVSSSVFNFPVSTIYGFDVAGQSRIGGLGANVDLNWLHTALGAISTLNPSAEPAGWGSPYPIPQCLAGHTYVAPTDCFDYSSYYQSLSGEELLFAPHITWNASLDYLIHVGRGILDPRVAFSYTDAQYDSVFENSYDELGARHLWNANVNYLIGKYTLEAYGTNLTNEIYIVASGSTVYYGSPRQFGVQLTYKF